MIAEVRPLVSIIVPVYNVERYLDECLDSIRAQTYARLEIIVVEDCSTDDSVAKLEPHLADSRIRVIQHERNSGLSAARNTGMEAACGEFVLFVDSDDAIAPTLVEACLASALETGADVVVFDFVAFQDGDALPEVGGETGLSGARKLEAVEYLKLPHFAWLKFMRAGLLRDPRLRFPAGYYYEDWPFHWELGFAAASIVKLDGAWYCYRQRDTSITASVGKKLLDQFMVQEMVLETVRSRGGAAEATVLFGKTHSTIWAVLTRIESNLLPEAMAAARQLWHKVLDLGPQSPAGARAATVRLLLALPGPLAGAGFRAVRGIKRFSSAASMVQRQDAARSSA